MDINQVHDLMYAGAKSGWPARAILATKHDGVDEVVYSLVEWSGRLSDKMVTIMSSTNIDEVQAMLDITTKRGE